MSAIFGVLHRDGRPVAAAVLDAMRERLGYRCKDGAKVWLAGPVGLGCCPLLTTPAAADQQLLVSGANELVLAGDARLDNREELLRALGWADRPARPVTTAELILGAYARWGEALPEHLLGDFALAIWDGQRETLFCARDQLGVRPLYVYSSAGMIAFATEIKGLLGLADIPRRLNEQRVADFLVGDFEDPSATFYQDIWRLPPGHHLAVRGTNQVVRCYWRLDPTRSVGRATDEEYALSWRELFTQAVDCRLRGQGLHGSTLSGGLDSSSIVSVGRTLLAQRNELPLLTFSAVFDDLPQCDERPFIGAVIDGGGLEPHLVHAEDVSPLGGIDEVLSRHDEVYGPANLFLHRRLCRAARNHGVRVLLDGLDGDTTVSYGLGHLTELAQAWGWQTFAFEAWSVCQRSFGGDLRVLRRLFLDFGIRPLVPAAAGRLLQRLRPPAPLSLDPVISPAFADRVKLHERRSDLEHRGTQAEAHAASTQRLAHWRALTSGILPYAMEVLDREAAAFGIQLAYPFMDRRLVEFSLALPASQKLHAGWTRWILRRAMGGILPERVRWRATKSDLSAVTTRGLLEHDRPVIEALLQRTPVAASEYVDFDALRSAYERLSTAVQRHGYAAREASWASVSVWKGASLALWLEHAGLTV